jgi:hypothetical protein
MLVLRRLRFRLALWWWTMVIPVLARGRELKSLIDRAAPGAGEPYAGLPAEYIARRVKRAARKPWFMRDRQCLREGLLAFRFLTLAGYRPELRFGVDRKSVARNTLSAHCWIVLDKEVLLNSPDPNMVEILIYRGGGQLQPPAQTRSPVPSTQG